VGRLWNIGAARDASSPTPISIAVATFQTVVLLLLLTPHSPKRLVCTARRATSACPSLEEGIRTYLEATWCLRSRYRRTRRDVRHGVSRLVSSLPLRCPIGLSGTRGMSPMERMAISRLCGERTATPSLMTSLIQLPASTLHSSQYCSSSLRPEHLPWCHLSTPSASPSSLVRRPPSKTRSAPRHTRRPSSCGPSCQARHIQVLDCSPQM